MQNAEGRRQKAEGGSHLLIILRSAFCILHFAGGDRV
jgi:hypothetical protein